MFIYTDDTIYNMDHIASMSVSIYRGDKLTCPAIMMISPTGKLSTLARCNTTSQCHELMNIIKESINNDENYTIPQIDLETISINVTIGDMSSMHNKMMRKRTFLVPREEPTILLNRLSVSTESSGIQNHILFDSDILYSWGNANILLKKWDKLELFINGELQDNNTIEI